MNEVPDIERIPSPIMIDTKENKQVSGATTNFSLGLHLYVQDMRWHAEERSLGEERGKRAWARDILIVKLLQHGNNGLRMPIGCVLTLLTSHS